MNTTNSERVVVGGTILILAILFGRFGGGSGGLFGRSGGGHGGGVDGGVTHGAVRPTTPAVTALLRIDGSGTSVDGVAVSEALAIQLCAGRGRVHVVVTGDARTGVVQRVLSAVLSSGVQVDAAPSVLETARATTVSR